MPKPRHRPERPLTPAEKQAAYRQRQEAARRAAQEAKGLPATAPIPTMPSLPRWKAQREQAQAVLQAMQEEMEAYRDGRSEQWQESDKGAAFQEWIEQVDAARAAVAEIDLP